MNFSTNYYYKLLITMLLLMLFSLSTNLTADTISTTDKYAWSENAGWLNFSSSNEQVTVYDDHLEGYVWSEAAGWIRLGTYTVGDAHTYTNLAADTYGVNNDGAGNLSGYGWGENIGWVNFDSDHSQVTIDGASGDFDGYAWSESIGWIHFQNDNPTAYKVQRNIGSRAYVPDPGNLGGSIAISATGEITSAFSITTSTADSGKPAGMTSPYGKISYQVTSSGATATVRLTFSTPLPDTFSVYKVDNAGTTYTPIPQTAGANGFWVKIDANTIEVTLKDGGTFDLDGATDGSILDPIVILAAAAATAIPTLSLWGLLLMAGLLSLLGRKKILVRVL